MEYEQVIHSLEKKLLKTLPGRNGQILMAPVPVDEARFALKVPENARKGAVLLLFYPGSKGCAFPLIKRPTYSGIHSAQVALPGEKWEESDRNLAVTALRETEEEIGVASDRIQIFGKLSSLYIPPSNFLVVPFVGCIPEKPKFIPDHREVEKIIHCDFVQLMDKQVRKEKPVIVNRQHRLIAPYFEIGGEMVWGATAMILSELRVVWGPSSPDENQWC